MGIVLMRHSPVTSLFVALACCAGSGACAKEVRGETSRSLCFALAAEHYGVPEELLRAMAHVESGFNPTARHQDTDGTYDLGVMQINSSHFTELAERYHITEAMLVERPCINIVVGASILKGFIAQYGRTWRAVGAYGAGVAGNKEGARKSYASLVAAALSKTWHAQQIATAAPARRMLVVE